MLFYYKGTVLSMDQLLTDQSFDGAIHPMFESSGILAFCYKRGRCVLYPGDMRRPYVYMSL